MTKKIVFITVPILIVAILISFIIVNMNGEEDTNYTYIEIDNKECTYLFGCSIEEFFDKEMEFYDETGDFREQAYVKENGKLVIPLTQTQKKKFRKSDWLNDLTIDDKPYIKVENGNLTVKIYIDADIKNKISDESFIKDCRLSVNHLFAKIWIMNLLDGIPYDENVILYVEYDVENDAVTNYMKFYNRGYVKM